MPHKRRLHSVLDIIDATVLISENIPAVMKLLSLVGKDMPESDAWQMLKKFDDRAMYGQTILDFFTNECKGSLKIFVRRVKKM